MRSVVTSLFSLFMLCSLTFNISWAAEPQHREEVGVSLGAYYWRQNYSGDFKISEFDIRPVDVETDLSISHDDNMAVFLEISHALTYLPKIKLQKTRINSSKNTTIKLGKFFSLDQIQFKDLRSIRSEMDFDHLDVDLFYRVWASQNADSELNLGLALRKFDGYTFVMATDNDLSKCNFEKGDFRCIYIPPYRLDFTNKVPLLYLDSTIDLGVPNLLLNANLHYGNYKKNEMTDIDLSLSYRLPSNILLYLGYRHAILDLGDFSGLVADITTHGLYGGLGYRF